MKINSSILTTLWIFLALNYIFCDVFSLYHSTFLNQLLTGKVEGIVFTEQFLLLFAIVMEIPLLMIVLTKVLDPKISRVLNLIIGALMIVVQIRSLITGANSLHYIFFSMVEISILVTIILIALKWKKEQDKTTML